MHALYVELNPDAFLCSSVVFHVSCLFPVCKSSWLCLCWVNTGKLYCTCSCYVMFVVYFWGSCWRIESGVSMETTSGYHRRSFSVLQADNWSLISLWYKRTVCKFDYLLRCVCVCFLTYHQLQCCGLAHFPSVTPVVTHFMQLHVSFYFCVF